MPKFIFKCIEKNTQQKIQVILINVRFAPPQLPG